VNQNNTQLGLGLIGIGKPWGHVPRPVPSELEARALLDFAYELGIRYFDTAPSYGDGVSEERLGGFLRSMPAGQRVGVVAATKMGEHWDRATDEPYADHSFDALRRSLDRSMARLGRIDILQLHKTTPEALRSDEVARAWEYARSLGIARVGPSVSDLESARIAVETPGFSVMQFPFHRGNPTFAPVLEMAAGRGMWIAVNRPFAMGAMVDGGAFRFILGHPFTGAILSGTTSKEHLRENWNAFLAAMAECR
jgi:aryl-alcohol dehydrogenase-like predicted oxidoreductase